MAVQPITPLVLKDVELLIGTDDFRKHVDGVTFTPTASQVSWTGLGLNTHTDTTVATWTCTLSYAQDWDSATSLSRYLYDNEGDTVTIEFSPRSGSGPSFTAEAVITPGAIGGAVNAFAPASVTLGLNGRPTLVPAV